ncbi:MAG TPA: hypothetical protein EYP91_12570 [Gammaproteobacteria bacterium]|nr:hypothetical protein [Gammaproteobacteria bacterium]
MPDIMLLGVEKQVLSLEIDENPADNFPCMPSEGIDSEMRVLLYALLMGIFFDEAQSMEQLVLEYSPEGPWVFKLDFTITERLAEVEEDDIDGIALNWIWKPVIYRKCSPGSCLTWFIFVCWFDRNRFSRSSSILNEQAAHRLFN